MALEKMKTMQTGTKNKEKNSKFGRIKLSRRDTNNTINPDLSNLRKPIDTSISTLYHISKLLEDSTEEVKSILNYECDIIYECRICHSLFRSIVNLISHKREYCKEKFNITLNRKVRDDLNTISAVESAIDTCQAETIIRTNLTNDRILRSQVSKETCKKDLTAIIDTLIKRQKDMYSANKSNFGNVTTEASSNQHIYLRSIETNNSAVYQTIESPDTIASEDTDLTTKEVMELQNTMEKNNTMLEEHGNENQSEKGDNPTQTNPSDEGDKLPENRTLTNNLICPICNSKFSTKKTLTFHVKTLHTIKRERYSCPCCTNTFANTWSVYRHLFKVHKKNNQQVRSLRLRIHEIPFDIEGTAMLKLRKTRTPKTSAAGKIKNNNDLENNDKAQEETARSEFDVEDTSCNGCGKKFDTKTALSAHSQHCQVLIATVKINQSDSSTSSDSALTNSTSCELKDTDASKTNSERSSSSPEIIDECHEADSWAQPVSTPNKEVWLYAKITPIPDPDDRESPTIERNSENLQSSKIVYKDTSETKSVNPEVIPKKDNTLNHSIKKRINFKKKRRIIRMHQNDSTLNSIWLNKIDQNLSMENKMAAITNLRKLQCLLCKRKFTSMTSLRRHMAVHIGWHRYRCKLCDFKCFFKCDCIMHCHKMHAKNNEAFGDMVIEISPDENRRDENVVTSTKDVEEKTDHFDDHENRTASSSQSEMREDFSSPNDTSMCNAEKSEEAATMDSTTNVPTQDDADKVTTMDSTKNVLKQDDADEAATICTNLKEYMEKRTRGKLDIDSDLKRMVMEVIFGSNDTDNAVKQADLEEKLKDNNNEARGDAQSNDNENSTATAEDTRLAYCSVMDIAKPQRPMRKRIKPLSKDFIYDLKNIQFRKESGKSQSFQLGKSSAKQHLSSCDSETNAQKKVKLHN